jgi:hypothetical protein
LFSFTINVGNLIEMQLFPGGFLQYLMLPTVVITVIYTFLLGNSLALRPSKSHLVERPLQNLHEAVGISMVMDPRTMALTPAHDQQVKLTIPFINQISGVSDKRKYLLRKLNFCVCNDQRLCLTYT